MVGARTAQLPEQVQGGSIRSRRLTITDVVDLAIVVGLSVAAYVLRRPGLPRDGLFADDAWVAGGAVFGSIGDVAMTGGGHPGFTTLLWFQHHLVGGPAEHLAAGPFLVGVLGPAVVYACLRSLGCERTSSLLAAGALVVTYAHLVYSGHVKAYTLDVVVVMALAAMLPRLADRRWTWWGVVGWIGFALVIGSLSGYQMLASALAMFILVLHPQGDRWKRLTALGVQVLIQAGWVLHARQFVDFDEIEAFMDGYDAHVERSRNPITLGRNVFDHLSRVIDVHPGGPTAILGLVAVGVVVGLVLGAAGRLGHARTLASQFALAALVVAAIGGVLQRFPFGPSTTDWTTGLGTPGARHGLWLVPMTSLGLCNVIDLGLRAAAKRPPAQTLLRCALVASTLLLVTSRWEPALPLRQGAQHLARTIDAAAAEGAYIVLDKLSAYQYLVLTDRPVELVPAPEEMIGYVPVPDPAEGVVLGNVFTPSDVTAFIAGTRHDELVFAGVDVPYGAALERAGWERVDTEGRGGYRVSVWRRS